MSVLAIEWSALIQGEELYGSVPQQCIAVLQNGDWFIYIQFFSVLRYLFAPHWCLGGCFFVYLALFWCMIAECKWRTKD